MNNNTKSYYRPKQGRLPVFIAESLEISDLVLAFDKIMEEIGIERYLKPEERGRIGRRRYSRVNMGSIPRGAVHLCGHTPETAPQPRVKFRQIPGRGYQPTSGHKKTALKGGRAD